MGHIEDLAAKVEEIEKRLPPKPAPGKEPIHTASTEQVLQRMQEEAKLGDALAVRTGWEEIDGSMGKPMRPPWTVCVAARTGVGKTWIVQHLALQALKSDPAHRVVFLPFEMAPHQMGERVSAHVLGESPRDVHNQAWHGEDVAGRVLAEGPYLERMRWHDRRLTIQELPRLYEGATRDFGGVLPTVFVVDYMGLMRWHGRQNASQYERASEVAWGLKDFALEHNVLLICAVQMNRAGGKDGTTEPSLDSMRDSGAIEEAADLVMMFWRVVSDDTEHGLGSGTQVKGKIAKNRHGGYGKVVLGYDHALRLNEEGEYDLPQKGVVPWQPGESLLDPDTPF